MVIEELTDSELIYLCKILDIPIIQVRRKDEINITHDGAYIINLQSVGDGAGSHWTALYRINKKNIYFDSFGVMPPYEIVKMLKNEKICYFEDQIQDIISTACGYYCIVFLYTMTTSKTIEDGIKKIDKMFTAPESNDNVLKTILEKILKKN